ncbi:site-specific integrase [Shewanella insulae]|uniref:site-specific integrase n=1 Tax=Shewanella insulae TaxID=2681496 RepID=UPI001EFC3CFF|nr:site-specific integrase [Shewanella insulae]MCG9738301.1 site-specific integrase [Shewanella insulae]
MKLKRLRMTSGEDYAILLGEDGMPLAYPNLFVTLHHRNKSDSTNTCIVVFEHIKFLHEICDFLQINLIERCKRGEFLSKSELELVAMWARRTVKGFREQVLKDRSTKVIEFKPNFNRLETARATIKVSDKSDISPQTAYYRLITFSDYICWLESYLFPSQVSNTKQWLEQFRPRKLTQSGVHSNLNQNYRSFTKEQQTQIFDLVRPDSPENPWSNESLRYRNQLIVHMLDALGCRKGELLRIRHDDIGRSSKTGFRYVLIRNNTDLDDVRTVRPEAKTLGRKLPMDSRLSEMYDNYLIHHLAEVQGAGKIPYVFITHSRNLQPAKPLSISACNKIFSQITARLGFHVFPHAFRHTWNDRYSEFEDKRIELGETTPAKSEANRQKLMGWRANSKMALYYSRRHVDKSANDVGLALQELRSANMQLTYQIDGKDIKKY